MSADVVAFEKARRARLARRVFSAEEWRQLRATVQALVAQHGIEEVLRINALVAAAEQREWDEIEGHGGAS